MKKLLSAHGAGRFAADKKQPANNNNYHLRQIIKGFIAHKKRDRSGLGGQAGAPIIIDSPATSKVADKLIATSKVADKLIATSKVADKLIAPHEMARLALAPTLLLAIPLVTAEAQTFKLNQSAQTVKLTQTAQIDQVTPTPTKLQDNEYLSAERGTVPTSSRNGFFVHLHGLAVFPIPLDNLKYTSLHDDIYNYKFAADLGYGGGASIGYNFSYFFVAANYDYIHYPFTLVDDREIINHVSDVDALGKKGTVDNHLITLGGGLRAGERFGFSLGAYYGFDLMTINQLAYLPTLSLRQTHIIGQLELDYIFSDRLKLGLLARYDYGFAANNDIIYVGNTHLLGAGASCTILF